MPDVVEVLADDNTAQRDDATPMRWPTGTATSTGTIVSDLDWTLAALGAVHQTARDLVRIAGAAYIADRTTRRSDAYFSRRLALVVHVDDPDPFLSPTGQRLADLLAWLTGDAWTITPVANASAAAPDVADVPARAAVQLMSGGLDSLCGALIAADGSTDRLHLGHRDNTRATAKSQSEIELELRRTQPEFDWFRVRFTPAASVDNSTRTRSLLFMALAVAAASARSASRVIVPENGFTSLNPPLIPSRGGALSTKSTHPWTFRQMNLLLDELGLSIQLDNPHALQTKGEMLAEAAAALPGSLMPLVAQSISCAKMDGARHKGGNPNYNCGLCIACLVRRGAFVGAGLTDPTRYLIDVLGPDARAKFVHGRRADVWAVQTWAQREPTIDDLMVAAPWPTGTDYETMLDVVVRGRSELLGALDLAL